MKVLIDYHHADLAESLQILFGDRFGWEVYFPTGMEWFDAWYWSFERAYHGDKVARQYLTGIWLGMEPADGIIDLPDTRHAGRIIRGITLDRARSEQWDLVISSVPENAPGFAKFASEQGAHWGIHIGNQWGAEAWERRPEFAIVSSTSEIPAGVNHAVVHQEFSLDVFRYEPPQGFGPVRSFVNCFPEMTSEYQGNFVPTALAYPEFGWEVYGAYGSAPRDQFAAQDIHGVSLLADAMRAAGVIWHAKHWSDGFGHVVHNAFAVGRPVFGYQRYYADKLAGPLWVDGVTSIDVESRSRDEVFAEIRRLRDDPEAYAFMCRSAALRFREVVDFDGDAAKVRRMLDGVLSDRAVVA